jgi:hypothetical protein
MPLLVGFEDGVHIATWRSMLAAFWETKEAYSFVAIKNPKSLMDRSDAGYNKGFGSAL